jgi:protein SCO1/2
VHARLRIVILGLTACAVAALIGVTLAGSEEAAPLGAAGFEGAIRPPGAKAVEFTSLRDQDGTPVTLASLGDGPAVVTFVYSTCEDTCPLQVQSIRGALDRLGSDVPVVGVSVDPSGDTPLRAKRFMLKTGMTGRMRFVLGHREALERVWRAYGIRPQSDDLDHSSYTVLIDGARRQRIGFPADQLTARRLEADLRKLGA